MNKIARFEALAERLVEGTFARLFADRLSPLEVVRHLARAMEDRQEISSDGVPRVPTHYSVHLSPDDYDTLTERQALEAELAHHVVELASQTGLRLACRPTVHILADEDVASHDVHITAQWAAEEATEAESTRQMDDVEELSEDEAANVAPPGRPFLIMEGKRHFDLFQAVVSIGRALDNDIILEDPRVSRHHAQLRRRYGRYVLYDLGSSGGTQINGYPIEECVLHSGDVISLAGVQVIYGEDPRSSSSAVSDEETPSLAHQ